MMTILTKVVIKKVVPPTEHIRPETIRKLCNDCTRYEPGRRPKAMSVLNTLLSV